MLFLRSAHFNTAGLDTLIKMLKFVTYHQYEDFDERVLRPKRGCSLTTTKSYRSAKINISTWNPAWRRQEIRIIDEMGLAEAQIVSELDIAFQDITVLPSYTKELINGSRALLVSLLSRA